MVFIIESKSNFDMKLAELYIKISGREVDIIQKALHHYVTNKLFLFDRNNPEEARRAEDMEKLNKQWETEVLSSLTK